MNLPLELSSRQLPMRLRPQAPMSERELLRFCAVNDILRIEREPNGDLLIMTPVGLGTSAINMRVASVLFLWTETHGRGMCTGPDGGYNLPDGSMRSPDAAWTSSARLDLLSAKDKRGYPPVCPDFVIEIRSQSDRLLPLKRKMARWIANGAHVAWLIDPKSKTVTIYRPDQEPEAHHDPSSVQGDGPVRGFELVMGRIWD